jgi:amphi-Trp domain-containing protein
MGRDRFEFARVASPDEVAEYLTSLAQGLKRGEVALESGGHMLRLVPPGELKVAIYAKVNERRGKIAIEVGWKRPLAARAGDLKVGVASRPAPSARPDAHR